MDDNAVAVPVADEQRAGRGIRLAGLGGDSDVYRIRLLPECDHARHSRARREIILFKEVQNEWL